MGLFIKQNGEITRIYPNDVKKGFSLKQIKTQLHVPQNDYVGILVVKNGGKKVIKFWYDITITEKSKLNKTASLISLHFNEYYLYGDVIIEGEIKEIANKLKINIPEK